ncbi:MAG: ATP-binding protein, partial [Thermoproteus sp.]
MRITKLIELKEIPDRVILIGGPGIGKTEILVRLAMAEAERLGRQFVDLRYADEKTLEDIERNPSKYYVFLRIPASHLFAEDVIGIPQTRNGYVEF